MAKRKRCMVYIDNGNKVYRCENKIKPGTPFCAEHFKTHRLVEVKCTGEAHDNPFIDHCGICMPHWGKYPVAIPKDREVDTKDWEGPW